MSGDGMLTINPNADNIRVSGNVREMIHKCKANAAKVSERGRKDADCPDFAIKASGLAPYMIAFAAFKWQGHSPEARELAKRWKLLYARYASLSERYRQNVHAMRALSIAPHEMSERMRDVDAKFDVLSVDLNKLFEDLARWADTWELVED